MVARTVNYAAGAADNELLQLYDFFGAIRRRLFMIACISLAFGIAMGVLAFTMRPIYRGSAVIAPVTSGNNSLTKWLDSSPAGGLFSALSEGASEEDKKAYEAVAVLGSREFTERFLSDENLLPVLFQKKWDSKAGKWKEGIGKTPTLELGFAVFDKIRKIVLDGDTDYIELQIDWPDRFKAAEWANQMAERLNAEMRERTLANAKTSLTGLQMEFASTSDVETRAAISSLIESEEKKKMLANVMPDYAVRIIDKAVVADADSPQLPKKPLMVVLGLVFGFLVGIAVSLLLYRRELSSRGLL
jgi:uncharacterized protein involved in exopolysaccharide biosynthesis